MESSAIIERVEQVLFTRADAACSAEVLKSALGGVRELRSFFDAAEADLARRLAAQVSFPEKDLADTSRGSLNQASKTLERAATLDATPRLADALDAAAVTAGHVDAVTRAAKALEPEQRDRLHDRVDTLVDVAVVATVEEFGRRVRHEASQIAAADGVARLERQRRATSLSSWVDGDGMWNLRGTFDPITGVKLSTTLDTAVRELFAEEVPDTCPTDPILKQAHLRALALASLLDGTAGTPGGTSGRPEFVAVLDIAAAAPVGADADERGAGGVPEMSWPIPIEVPHRILAELIGDADVHAVVVRNGVVLHAPGELDLGRSTRWANRAQRRALRGLYHTCAIPGCAVHYDRCNLHHIIWWRHGGRTDLDNLIPICTHHHHKIHDHGWNITIGPNRELTLTLPDGTIHNTGPPQRLTA